MNIIPKMSLAAALLLAIIGLSGPAALGDAAAEVVGGGGKCVLENPCWNYCTAGEKYAACGDSSDSSDWCMQFTWSPCGMFDNCADLTSAMGDACFE